MYLAPASDEDSEAMKKLEIGPIYRFDFKQMRNYRFLKKYFALLKIAYEPWQERAPSLEYHGHKVVPNFESFREQLIILAGYYVPTYAVDGRVQLKAKSISFAQMNEDEFEKLYSDTIDVILQKIDAFKGMKEGDMRRLVDSVMGFV